MALCFSVDEGSKGVSIPQIYHTFMAITSISGTKNRFLREPVYAIISDNLSY